MVGSLLVVVSLCLLDHLSPGEDSYIEGEISRHLGESLAKRYIYLFLNTMKVKLHKFAGTVKEKTAIPTLPER